MTDSLNTVCVIGLGYIGLPTAATLAGAGMEVKGVDIREDVVDALNDGRAHFAEPDLDMLVVSAVESGRLTAFAEPQPADAFVITVPTPIREDKSPDMRFVEEAARNVATVVKAGDLVVLESTSPVGTTENLAQIIAEARPDLVEDGILTLSVAYCPERILPGQMVRELVENDRIVGGLKPEDSKRAILLYEHFVRGEILETDAKTAEMVKLIENAYRDVNIAFANEVANLADPHGIDPWEAIRLANHHPRVNILNPGPGVGGHCIAVDPWFLISPDPKQSPLMEAARIVNDGRPETVLRKVRETAGQAGGRTIACLGLAFKPDVDDLRESPAVEIVGRLAEEGFAVAAVEPHVSRLPDRLAGRANVDLVDLEAALSEADLVLLLVAHSDFAEARPKAGRLPVIDCVGLWRDS